MHSRDSSHTKVVILEAAERLYADEGVEGLSLRTITEHAAVNLASINYHFRTKLALTEAMLSRFLEPLTDESVTLLQAMTERYGERLRAAHVVAALALPTLRELLQHGADTTAGAALSAAAGANGATLQDAAAGPSGKHRLAFMLRAATDQSPVVRHYLATAFDTRVAQFEQAFARVCARLPPDQVSWRIRLFCHSLPGTLCNYTTVRLCRDLVIEQGLSHRDALIRLAVLFQDALADPVDDADAAAAIDDLLAALAGSVTLRGIAFAQARLTPSSP